MIKRQIAGVVHWCDDSRLVRSIGSRIELSKDRGRSFRLVAKLDFGPIRNLAARHRLARRLTRAEVKHLVPLDNMGQFLVIANKKVFSIDVQTGDARLLTDLVGSHPLRICHYDSVLYYGEYRSNPARTPIRIWGSANGGVTWEQKFQFSNVRHVHGVFYDSIGECFWVTTGDTDVEAGVWKIDTEWKNAELVLSGSQQSRVIDLLFSREKVFFGTDAPNEQNWIYSMDRKSRDLKRIASVNGTVFHAKKTQDAFYFSTACEPGIPSDGKDVKVFKLKEGKLEEILSLRKDCWSMKYFQYGQIRFASGSHSEGAVWVSPLATSRDQCSLLLQK